MPTIGSPALAKRRPRQVAVVAAIAGVVGGVAFLSPIGPGADEVTGGVVLCAVLLLVSFVALLTARVRSDLDARVPDIELDATAYRFVAELTEAGHPLRIIAVKPDDHGGAGYRKALAAHLLTDAQPLMFLEVAACHDSPAEGELIMTAQLRYGHRVLRVVTPRVPGVVAAVLLYLRDCTGRLPRVYLTWAERRPLVRFLRFVVLGIGEVPLLTREILWRAEPDAARRPTVHVG